MASVRAPITLIGLGRSGTTLIERVFASINRMTSCGETAGLIFGTYAGALDSYFSSSFTEGSRDQDEQAARVVRRLFLSLFPIEEANGWFHKPAGLPKMVPWPRFLSEGDATNFPTQWYWDVLHRAFPEAKYLTVLRNPWDVVSSRMAFSGWDEEAIWDDVKIFYDVLENRRSTVDVIFFDDLVKEPKETITGLCDRLNLPVPENLSALIAHDHVSTKPGDGRRSHAKEWSSMSGPASGGNMIAEIANMWQSFGRTFQQPDHVDSFSTEWGE